MTILNQADRNRLRFVGYLYTSDRGTAEHRSYRSVQNIRHDRIPAIAPTFVQSPPSRGRIVVDAWQRHWATIHKRHAVPNITAKKKVASSWGLAPEIRLGMREVRGIFMNFSLATRPPELILWGCRLELGVKEGSIQDRYP